MGLFDRLRGKNNNDREEMVDIDGYQVGANSGIIYRCPQGLRDYKLPEGTKGIKNEAIMTISRTIQTLEVPASFKTFDTSRLLVLHNCQNLTQIKLAEGIEDVKLTSVKNNNNDKKVSFNIPKSITNLEMGVYVAPNGRLVLENHVKSIAEGFASHDYSLQYVEIPGSIEHLSHGAFNQCGNLETVIVHEGVKSANDNKYTGGVFRGCNKLKRLELPESFNGSLGFSMDGRTPGYEEGMKSDVTIGIERNGKHYEFQVRRSELASLSLQGDSISFNYGKEEVKLEISQLDTRALHKIQDGKAISELPPEIKDKQKIERIRENLYPESQGVTPSVQPVQKRTLANVNLNRYGTQKMFDIIHEIQDNNDEYDLTSIPDIRKREIAGESLSPDDADNLCIALHSVYQIYQEQYEKNVRNRFRRYVSEDIGGKV